MDALSPRRFRVSISLLALLLVLTLLGGCGEPPDTPIESDPSVPTATPLPVSDRKGSGGVLEDEQSFTSPDLAFSVSYPGDWEVDESSPEDGIFFYPNETYTLFWVQMAEFGGTAKQANQRGIEQLQQQFPDIDLEFAGDPTSFRIAGLTGLTQDYRYTNDDGVELQGSFFAITTGGGESYMITIESEAERYEQDLAIFDPMLESFRISGVAVGPSEPVVVPPSERTEAEWLIMLYFDADDNILERDMMVDFNEVERVGSTDKIHIVAQVDRYAGAFSGMGDWTTTKRFYLTQDNDLGRVASQELADLGELNMADGETLEEFITWAAVNYPARKHVLIMSDHGAGWPGGYNDPAPGGRGDHDVVLAEFYDDSLWLMELEEAIGAAREATGMDKFELIGFDACLMGQLEVYSSLIPHARYAVASEELEPALGWAYTSFLSELKNNPAMDGAELSEAIVRTYIDQDQRIRDNTARRQFLDENGLDPDMPANRAVEEMSIDITLSAIDLSALPALNAAVDEMAAALLGMERRTVTNARANAQSYETVFDPEMPSPYIDLGHFARKISKQDESAEAAEAAEAVLTALNNAVISQRYGPERPGSNGIAIYFPTRKLYEATDSNWDYTLITEPFSRESQWDDFLDDFYGEGGGNQRAAFSTRGGSQVAGGAKPLHIEPLQLSSEIAAPGQPVTIQTEVSGDNLGFIYSFVGRVLQDEQLLIIEDMDYLFADETQEIDGIPYPVWTEEGVPIDYEWEPILYALSDGTTSVRALFAPDTYGDVPTYSIEGSYTFADGSPPRFAKLYFRDGELVQTFGYTGQGGVGAPREITPQPGDQFTVFEQVLDLGEAATGERSTREGGTVTFREETPFIEETPAPSGSYIVGFIAEDLDGQQFEQFESLFVESEGTSAVEGFAPYSNEALGLALLYPEPWAVEEDNEGGSVTFSSEASTEVLIFVESYPDTASSQEANTQAIQDTVALLSEDGEFEALEIGEAEESILGAFDAELIEFTFTFDGEPYAGIALASTPVEGTTYLFLVFTHENDYDAMVDAVTPMLDSFDILISGVSKEEQGAETPALASESFADSFDDATSGLVEAEDEWGATAYTDGSFTIELLPYAGPIFDYYADQTLPEAFLLQATTSYDGSDNNGYGLVFRLVDESHFYLFRISGDGFYTVERAEGEALIPLIDWTPSERIDRAAGAPNTLAVEAQGDQYLLSINGREVYRFQDATYQAGTFGVIGDNFDEGAPTTLRFEEIRLGSAAR